MTILKHPLPRNAILLGLIGGGVLGSLLAYGVLSFVWWRREVNQQAEFEAKVEAMQEADRRKKQAEQGNEMLQYSLQPRKP